MTTFLLYILKTSICLVLFYPFYMLLLSRETFHRFNRIALLSILIGTAILPIVQVSIEEPLFVNRVFHRFADWVTGNEYADVVVAPVLHEVEAVAMLTETESPLSKDTESSPIILDRVSITLFIYIGGILFLLFRHVVSIIRLFMLLRKSTCRRLTDGVILCLHNRSGLAPFSWWRFIVVSEDDYSENSHQIVTHERAHIALHHSLDLLFAELCCMMQWFNPTGWLIKKELQNIHEYEADKAVISQGIDAKEYQTLIIKKAVGARLYSLANSLNHSSLKKRLTMMLKEKSNPWARLKYLYVLPLAATTLVAFAHPEVANNSNDVSVAKGTELSSNEQESGGEKLLDVEKYSIGYAVLMGKSGQKSARLNLHLEAGIEKSPEMKEEIKNFAQTAQVGDTLHLTRERGKENKRVIETKTSPSPTEPVEVTARILHAETGKPMHGASVVCKGRGTGLIVNKDGDFFLKVNLDDTIEISHVGMTTIYITGKELIENARSNRRVLLMNEEVTDVTATEKSSRRKTYSVENNEGEVFMVVEDMPQFPGGMNEMIKYLGKNIRYPQQASKDSIQGRVIVQFIVNKEGNITQPTILRSVSPELDAEAIRVVDSMPQWTPGKQRGMPVNVKFTLPISFQLNSSKAEKRGENDVIVKGEVPSSSKSEGDSSLQ